MRIKTLCDARKRSVIIELSEQEWEDATEDLCGFCLACGYEQAQCEPDARKYTCEACGEARVYGAEEALMMGRVAVLSEL